MVQNGQFREDLFYRLNVFPLKIPPLRERLQDIPILVHHFITKHSRLLRLSTTPRLSSEALPKLFEYPWPGNVRELENLVYRVLVIDPQGPLQLHEHLPVVSDQARAESDSQVVRKQNWMLLHDEKKLTDVGGLSPQFQKYEWIGEAKASIPSLDQAMADHIRYGLQLCNGKIYGPGGVGELLKINPNTLRKRMDKLGIVYGRTKLR
jgi:transcriptional regulator with GAF, ATPase, and Fis domain